MADAIDRLNEALADRYTLRHEIGRGGMSVVFLADDHRHDRRVAIKVLEPALGGREEGDRFQEEIRTTANLHHPNILPLFDSGEATGRLFYVMPVVEGESLRARLAREGPLAIDEAVGIARAVAEALQYAHDRGIVHRDVKPGNILLHVGRTLLADFGISLVAGRHGRLTAAGVTIGSPQYMSPEQIEGEGEATGRSDQYALACVLFEMLEGAPPFGKGPVQATLAAHLVREPPSLSRGGVAAAALAAVIRRAMAKDPSERFDSAADFAAALESATARPDVPDEGPPGLVVLPFENLSPDPGNEYLSDGLTEEVIADLTQIRGLRVISRTSAMRLKSSERDVGSLARELGVRYVLEGGVRKMGDALRITARLVDARDDAHLWARRFDGTMADVFEIQEQVARATVDALRVRLSPGEADALSERPIADARAYESYLRARFEAWRFSKEGLERARRYIDAALDIVGDNELLYGTLGHIAIMYMELGLDPGDVTVEHVDALADRIFSLNPESVRGHWIKAFVTFQSGDTRGAVRWGERARRLGPEDPDVLLFLGYVYAHVGRTREARVLVERAAALDPLTPLTQCLPGFVAVMEGRFDDAIEPYRRARDLDPDSAFTWVFLGWALGYAGRFDEAVAALDEADARFPDGPMTAWGRSLAAGLRGDGEAALRGITPGLLAAAEGSEMFARALADCYALAGETEKAIDWVEREVELGMLNHAFLAEHDRFLDSLRGEPRFEAILRGLEGPASSAVEPRPFRG